MKNNIACTFGHITHSGTVGGIDSYITLLHYEAVVTVVQIDLLHLDLT